jgi:thioredoxin-dependent peroxiredoxin
VLGEKIMERKGYFKFAGQELTVIGADLIVGQTAPDFTAQKMDWTNFSALNETKNKVRIIGSLPSFSTSVCDLETRRFNQEAATLGDDIAILMVSMDVPFTLANWCAAAGVDKVLTLSDHLKGEFGEKYGVLLKEIRIFRRAIFVVDRKDRLVYVDYMPELGLEPKYDQVLEAAQNALT